MFAIVKILISAIIIDATTEFSRRYPQQSGMIVAYQLLAFEVSYGYILKGNR